jgi:type I restriction enzyme M protein
MSDWGGENLKEDVRWKYGVPPAGNANFALQQIVHHANRHAAQSHLSATMGSTRVARRAGR